VEEERVPLCLHYTPGVKNVWGGVVDQTYT
jgi:hypothetical protein